MIILHVFKFASAVDSRNFNACEIVAFAMCIDCIFSCCKIYMSQIWLTLVIGTILAQDVRKFTKFLSSFDIEN